MADLTRQIDSIKERLPIESVVGQRVQLQRKGNRLWGLCPFHAEKTPSFSVLPERGFFKCFGCEKGGDIITFVRELDGLDFMEALRLLADQAGVELPQASEGESHRGSGDRRKLAREALAQARRLFQQVLTGDPGHGGRDYLAQRKVDEEWVRSFGLGWAPAEPGWLSAQLRRKGLPESALVDAGLAMPSDRDGSLRDRFWDRLIFPVQEAGDRTVGFGGRYLPGSRAEERGLGKYVNSPEGLLFPKRRLLYGLEKLQAGLRQDETTPILVCEGYLDVIMLHQAGFPTAVAALGTALTEDHARRLKRYQRPVALMLDADPAGRRAAARGARILVREGVDVRVVELPDGKDPADLVAEGQREELLERVASAWDIIHWRLSTWSQKSDFRAPSVKAKAAEEMAEWAQSTPNPALAELWLRTASDGLGIEEQSLRRLAGPAPARPAARFNLPASPRPLTEQTAQEVLLKNEREIVASILLDPSLIAAYRETLSQLQLHDAAARTVLAWCLKRRAEALDCRLLDALAAFHEADFLAWLDPLRLVKVADSRSLLEDSLAALEPNREDLRRASRGGAQDSISDEELKALRRPIHLSPNEETA